jgi:tRNA A37 threonylcarbamoyladenosine biosynthesis protein TsaE
MEGDGITAIEWAPTAASMLPVDHLAIDLAFGAGENARIIRFTARGERSRRILDELGACVSSR